MISYENIHVFGRFVVEGEELEHKCYIDADWINLDRAPVYHFVSGWPIPVWSPGWEAHLVRKMLRDAGVTDRHQESMVGLHPTPACQGLPRPEFWAMPLKAVSLQV